VLTTVTVVPPAGAFWSPLVIPVLAPDDNGVFAEKVTGLEPVNADITTNSYNELDGAFYVGSRVDKRNIVISLVMEHRSKLVSEVRRDLYGYFSPKLPITLQLDFTDRDSVLIDGYVESFEGDRFSNEPNADVSIICPNPNFRATAPVEVTGYSIYGDDPTLHDVLNPGNQAVGFDLRVLNDTGDTDFAGSIHIERMIESSPGVYYSTQVLYLDNTDGSLYLPAALIQYVHVNTEQGKKVAEIWDQTNDQQSANLLGLMTDDSMWPQLWPAMHKFRVLTTDTTGWAGHALNWILTFTPEWNGV
jgi:hypothetical protein